MASNKAIGKFLRAKRSIARGARIEGPAEADAPGLDTVRELMPEARLFCLPAGAVGSGRSSKVSQAVGGSAFPPNLPFPACFFAVEGDTALDARQAEAVGLGELHRRCCRLTSLGLLASEAGVLIEVVESVLPPEGALALGYPSLTWLLLHRDRGDSDWLFPTSDVPRQFCDSVRLAADGSTTVECSPSGADLRLANRLSTRKLRVRVPDRYYTIDLSHRPRVNVRIRDARNAARPHLVHRHDRRSHERLLVRRGARPIDAETKLRLEKARYRVFESQDVPEPLATALRRRGKPPKHHHQWVALRTTQVRATVVGEASLPYVPASRVVGRLSPTPTSRSKDRRRSRRRKR